MNYKKIKSNRRPEPIRFDAVSVWVSENTVEITVESENGVRTEYEFDQKRYSKDEYMKLLADKNAQLEAQITDTQLALCEIYEGMM